MWAGDGYQDAYLIALLVMVPYTVDLMQNLGLTIMQVENKYAFRGVVYAILAAANIAAVFIISPAYGLLGLLHALASSCSLATVS